MSLDVYLETPACSHCGSKGMEVYHNNITYNLNTMAEDAGIYGHLWRPDEIGIVTAARLIDPLEAGLVLLKSDRARFEKHNPGNGWGDYDGLCHFVESYLAACREYPTALVRVWR